jgi:NAD(P)-dependent dehydrogenase (short-subunit alcohol dehydrogenase family)
VLIIKRLILTKEENKLNLNLKNKTAIITGGSDGIGKETARIMSEEGAKVSIFARNLQNLEKTKSELEKITSKEIDIYSVDVTDQEGVKIAVEQVIKKNNKVDILVNNAGTSSAHPIMNITNEIMADDIGTKLYGAIYMIQGVVPSMKKNGGGSIVNITTPGGKASGAKTVPTSVSRAAGISLTKATANELSEFNIRVNTVCVGLFKSGQHRRRYEERIKTDNNLTIDEFYDELGKNVPLGNRVGEAKEAASLITYLSSEEASYITGTAINIDGGASPVV